MRAEPPTCAGRCASIAPGETLPEQLPPARSCRDARFGCVRSAPRPPLEGRAERQPATSSGAADRPLAASRAAQLMGAMLEEQHRGRRQVRHLMTPAPRGVFSCRRTPARTATLIGVVVDDLVHPVLGQQLTTRAPVTGLGARLALSASLGPRLRLLTRLRSTLCPRLRRIRRRRRELLRESLAPSPPTPHALPQLPDLASPASPIPAELHARLPTRVIDRLRLRTLHTHKVRGSNQQSSL